MTPGRAASIGAVLALTGSVLACSSVAKEGKKAVKEAGHAAGAGRGRGRGANTPPPPPPSPASAPGLSSDVQTHCFGWPERQFDPQNHADGVSTRLRTGDNGVDVTLRTIDGGSTKISDLLALGKPLLLVSGSHTCPVFQEKHPDLAKTVAKYKDRVTVATVYEIEAHPKGPEPSPYKGVTTIHEYSDIPQAMTLDARIADAKTVTAAPGEQILVDDLAAGDENPFWCTWGTCANCAFLVGTDGKIAAVHDWYDPPSMEGSIDALLASSPAAPN
jgi:hypothetical protein